MNQFSPWADEPVHVYVPGSVNDPREEEDIPGVVIHRGPPLHPDDLAVVNGLRVTSPSRTLIDCAEYMDLEELRATFARAPGTADSLTLTLCEPRGGGSSGGSRCRCSTWSSPSSATDATV